MRYSSRIALYTVVGVTLAVALLAAGLTNSAPSAQAQAAASSLLGDADCSGDIERADGIAITRYALQMLDGVPTCPAGASEISLANADVDGDGDVDINDARIVSRCAQGPDPAACIAPDPIDDPNVENDLLENATLISPSATGLLIETLRPATADPDENNSTCIRNPESVWFKFQAPESNRVSVLSHEDDESIAIYRAVEGVTTPSEMSDLTLLSCGQPYAQDGLITEAGVTYWIGATAGQQFWVFDGVARCVTLQGNRTCPDEQNDRLDQATPIDMNSGWVDVPATTVEVTVGDDESGEPCFDGGTLWYQLVAPTEVLDVDGYDQTIAIYESIEPISPADWRKGRALAELNLVGCAPAGTNRTRVATEPGEMYFVAVSGPRAQDAFTLKTEPGPRPINDDLVLATPVEPSAAGTQVGGWAVVSGNATYELGEGADNCFRQGRGSVWHYFVAPESGQISILESNDDRRLGVFGLADGVEVAFEPSDLSLLSCGLEEEQNNIAVTPGELYWIASSGEWGQEFWLFDGDPVCVDGGGYEVCPESVVDENAPNDLLVNAAPVQPTSDGVMIDPLGPATQEADETSENCFRGASVWYRIDTPQSDRLSVMSFEDDHNIGIYRAVEGVTNPAQMSDLTLLSCAQAYEQAGLIVEPGETYWISAGATGQRFWLFDGIAQCVQAGAREVCPDEQNDLLRQATPIDMTSGLIGVPAAFVDATIADDEIGAPCIDGPTLWYEFVALSDLIELDGSRAGRNLALYEPIEPMPLADWRGPQMDDLKFVACGKSAGEIAVATGSRYFVAVSGEHVNDGFLVASPN